jgi:hypothetical protein
MPSVVILSAVTANVVASDKRRFILDPRREVGDVNDVGARRNLTLGELLGAKIGASVAAGADAFPGTEPLPALR